VSDIVCGICVHGGYIEGKMVRKTVPCGWLR